MKKVAELNLKLSLMECSNNSGDILFAVFLRDKVIPIATAHHHSPRESFEKLSDAIYSSDRIDEVMRDWLWDYLSRLEDPKTTEE